MTNSIHIYPIDTNIVKSPVHSVLSSLCNHHIIISISIIISIIIDININVVSTTVRSFERPIVPIDAELKGIASACQGLFLLFAYDL